MSQLKASEETAIEQRCVDAIRMLSVDAVQRANSGHPGAPMGLAPLGYVLWTKFMRHNPLDPNWLNRDRFVLSAGHASMLLYSLLHLTGYDVSVEDLKRFRQLNSKTPGHPEFGHTPGVDATTGPLGQGFANAVGFAIAEKMLSDSYNRPGHEVVDHRTFVVCSDGDLMEGVASEAASLAGTLRLGKLIVIYDDNGISIEGNTDKTFREDVTSRFVAYGFHVAGTVDGNDLEGIANVLGSACAEPDRPSLVTIKSVIGFGSPRLAGTGAVHGKALGSDEVAATRQCLDWDYAPFQVPDDVYDEFRESRARGELSQTEWQQHFDEYSAEYPELAVRLVQDIEADLPAGWDDQLRSLSGSHVSPIATRAVSGDCLHKITPALPQLVGGSADLAESNNTEVDGRGSFSPELPSGRNMHFGVREHAMGAISNGIALHGGLIPYAATFLIFSDYLRPAIRVGALSGAPAIWIFTHDSIGLGEDGPTHQPVSQLMGLRMIPNLTVIRPADADETVEAWRIAVENRKAPTALVLTRQNLPQLATVGATSKAAGNVQRGAYVISDTGSTIKPDIVLIGTGSETHLALQAAAELRTEGVAARVVSLPSWELFAAQSKDYRDSVLPPSVSTRVSIEAGSTLGWERYTTTQGRQIGIDVFGASGPGGDVMEHFGFTVENVLATARSLL